MTPDSRYVHALAPSPNHDERAGQERADILLLHYTGMRSGAEALAHLTDPVARVASHYFVDEDGRILQLVPEARRAWHAGAGSWHGRADLNSRSIGIEIVNPGHEHGYRPFPAPQVAALIELCRDCVERLAIRPELVLAHSDTAPARKEDPGELFPWDQLFRGGVGHFVEPAPIEHGPSLRTGAHGADVVDFQRRLRAYGYAVDIGGEFEETTRLATVAFQRHFRPVLVDGVADRSTQMTLARLLTALQTAL